MQDSNIQKLEILNQFKTNYPEWVNPELFSMKYCQDSAEAYLEMYFNTSAEIPAIINLDFIDGDFEPDSEVKDIPKLFNPDADVVDNAKTFVELDTYSLINCVDGLFTKEAEEQINDSFQKAKK